MSQPAAAPAPIDVGRSLLRGSAWMVGLRWGMRSLGLLNTFILARLLTPADFGLVTMAMVVVSLVEVLGQSGQMLALIRLPSPTRAHFDSVWTLNILLGLGITAILWAIAPFAPLYFHAARATLLIHLLALRPLINGFDNVGVVAFRKELQFGREFAFQLLRRVLTMLVTLGVALWLGDWRALVAGILGGQALGTVLSYVMHPYRPRLCLTHIREVLPFSGWVLATYVAQFATDRADEIVVGGIGSPTAMGLYNVASDTATSPTAEVVVPVARALFPVFARISHDAAALRAAYLDVFAATTLICVAIGGGIALVAGDFVAVALGPQWQAAVPLVRVLGIAGALFGIMQNGVPVLNATGHARLAAYLTASRAVVLLAALALAGRFGDILTVAWARAVVTLLFIPGILLALGRVMHATPADMLARAWRPLAAGLVMAAAVGLVHQAAPPVPLLRLPLDAASGAVAYTAAILLLWRAAGAPAGLEAAMVSRLRRTRARPARGETG